MPEKLTATQIRQSFLDFFVENRHTLVPSASLVPGGDSTLLFTNAGMVQFKDVFIGTDKRPYSRAVDAQKCMRVAGKHNDLEDVGRDDSHHTFFEMLGNWSFGDYYKKEAIAWAWQLLTEAWGLPKARLWATCFKDEKEEIPDDREAAEYWQMQPGMAADHILFFGRKENFWEMAETGPCGPCSEIHFDRGEEYCDKKEVPDHVCGVNHECQRFLELWNLVFIQYNRVSPTKLEALPARHVDTGMGFERIVSILQGVDSNYKTDLFLPLLSVVRSLTGHNEQQMYAEFTPYRVIVDHARAASFLIADGVVPGNIGRNYICRMIIRRASRFGRKIGLLEPFLAKVAEAAIESYGSFYPELGQQKFTILDNLTREEIRFAHTLESGTAQLEGMLDELRKQGGEALDGRKAFELYATYGLPFEIARDIAREQNLDVDEPGFLSAMEEHRLASGAGKAFGNIGGEDAELYAKLLKALQKEGKLDSKGVENDPYTSLESEGEILALVVDGRPVDDAQVGARVEVLLPKTGFYVESGGQVSDTGSIVSFAPKREWEIEVLDTRRPAAGIVVHVGEVIRGAPRVGARSLAIVDVARRKDIMRNHTATHLLHAALRIELGDHARQAGSLVAPGRLRFDFNHPEALTRQQIENVERKVNEAILADYPVHAERKSRVEALANGAVALFGEKYGENVRVVAVGGEEPVSRELCGGTHLVRTGEVGLFLIVGETSAAAGVRRIEAVTGRNAYEMVARRLRVLDQAAVMLSSPPDHLVMRIEALQAEHASAQTQIETLRQEIAIATFKEQLANVQMVKDIPVLSIEVPQASADSLRQLADRFRQRYASGICVLASVIDDRPIIVAAVSEDLTKRGVHAGELVKYVSAPLGGSGGGKPTLAQAGGKDATKLNMALAGVTSWLEKALK